jgi:hypothetical protein
MIVGTRPFVVVRFRALILRAGNAFQPAMMRTHSRACAVSLLPGNSRRSSTAAANSSCCSNAARIVAACCSVATNIFEAWINLGFTPERKLQTWRPLRGYPAEGNDGVVCYGC